MLEIIIRNSATGIGGKLDLLPDARIEIERPSDAFDEDLSSGEFSLPIEIPWTENNRMILGFAERMQNFASESVNTWICDVYADGYPEMIEASLNLLSKEGLISYFAGNFTANISASKGQFGNVVKNKNIRDYKYGENISWNNLESREFATMHAKGLYPALDYFAFAPVVIEEYFDTSKNYNGEFLALDTVNNLLSTGAGADDWIFARPISDDPANPTIPGNEEHIDFRTIPFFKAKYIVKELIENLGYSIVGSGLENALLDNLFIYNTRSIEDYDFNYKSDRNRRIIVSNHLPNLSVVEFLRRTFQFLNVYPTFPGGLQIELKERNAFVKQRSVLDVSAIVTESFSSEYVPVEDQGGYTLNYTKDQDDAYFDEAVRELEDRKVVASVSTRADLSSLNIGRPFTTEDVAFVYKENMYYTVADATVVPVLWNVFSERLQPLVVGNGNRPVEIGAGTLATYMELDENTGLYRRLNKLASRQQGSYINNKAVLVTKDFGLRFMFIKNMVIGGNSYPVSFNLQSTPEGSPLTTMSLALQGENSLGSYHSIWQDMQQHPEKYTLTLIADRNVLNKLAESNMIMVNNVLMAPISTSLSIPLSDTIKVKVVPI